jgi:hypothetical protein
MPQPEVVRRVKSYSSETGYVFQYQFQEMHQTRRGFSAGTEYVYLVWAQQKTGFPVKLFVKKDSLKKWTGRTGRVLTGTEEYAVAKMRLFQALDEIEGLAAQDPKELPQLIGNLVVDETNLDKLLERLDLS